MVYDLIEKFIGHRERKIAIVALIIIAGLSIFSMTAGIFSFLDKGLQSFPAATLRNGLGILLVIIGIGIWKNRFA